MSPRAKNVRGATSGFPAAGRDALQAPRDGSRRHWSSAAMQPAAGQGTPLAEGPGPALTPFVTPPVSPTRTAMIRSTVPFMLLALALVSCQQTKVQGAAGEQLGLTEPANQWLRR